ncbi:hypothetical protein OGZ01_32440 [Vibrio harveyi]|nr:hypothetical protein [Vibrio harveyi]
MLELDSSIELGEWRLRESVHEVIVYASYGSVFPGLRFKKVGMLTTAQASTLISVYRNEVVNDE